MNADEALDALRAAAEAEMRLREIGRALGNDGLTAELVEPFLRELRQQRWRACHSECHADHKHRKARRVEIDDGVSVDWEIVACFGDEQERHFAPGSRRTRQGTPEPRPLPSMMREIVEQIVIMSVDDIGIAPEGLGISQSAHSSAPNETAA